MWSPCHTPMCRLANLSVAQLTVQLYRNAASVPSVRPKIRRLAAIPLMPARNVGNKDKSALKMDALENEAITITIFFWKALVLLTKLANHLVLMTPGLSIQSFLSFS